jgi:predicted alpha/beta hydrolase family esterase
MSTLSVDADDLAIVASAMDEAGRAVSPLVGHSLGGAAVIAATAHRSETKNIRSS